MDSNTHISVRNLSVWYGEHRALEDISVDIPDRRITAIMGPSGCGKTTLLKSFNRLLDITDGVTVSGQVLVDGENVLDRGVEVTHIRRKMGLLAQKPYPLPMSIYDNVAYGPRIHGTRRRRELDRIVEHCLRRASLWDEVKDRLRSPATGLSLGQQQRLCLARGLAVKPAIILGDEPTSSLDPLSSRRIEELFLELKREYTVIIVTHTLRQARRVADHVLFVYLGRLVEHGSAKEFFSNPKQPESRAYIEGGIS
jgi:phosphate transport system ATP-binding protein